MCSLRTIAGVVLASCLCSTSLASGVGGGAGGGVGAKAKAVPKDPVIASAQTAIGEKKWDVALLVLTKGLAEKPESAYFHNLHAYSMRHSSQADMAQVFGHYQEALLIDPLRRGAQEHLG